MLRYTARLELLSLGLALGAASCARQPRDHKYSATGGLRFVAAARLTGAGDSVLVSVKARNDAGRERVLHLGGCGEPLVLRAYPEAGAHRRLAPAWDSALWRRATEPAHPDQVCSAGAVLRILAPGDSTTVATLAIAVRAVLGDSLPAGRYHVTVPSGAGELEAGTVELRAPPT